MNFGAASDRLKDGFKVARAGWNGKNMFLFYVADWNIIDSPVESNLEHLTKLPFICMKTADDKYVPWLASQTDVLADDWAIVMPKVK